MTLQRAAALPIGPMSFGAHTGNVLEDAAFGGIAPVQESLAYSGAASPSDVCYAMALFRYLNSPPNSTM
jgi:hypothetical protein